jgi:hypothetical protein
MVTNPDTAPIFGSAALVVIDTQQDVSGLYERGERELEGIGSR